MEHVGLTIGKLAHQCGVKAATARYYARRGLLHKTRRSMSGYRLYSTGTVPRSRVIRQAQSLGFSLAEIEDLMSLRMCSDTTCADIRARAQRNIADIDRKIEDLEHVRKALTKFVRHYALRPSLRIRKRRLHAASQRLPEQQG